MLLDEIFGESYSDDLLSSMDRKIKKTLKSLSGTPKSRPETRPYNR